MTLSLIRPWREHRWNPIDQATYTHTWQRYGGSVMTHPEVVEKLSGLAGIPVRYLGRLHNGEYQAAIATWGRFLALSRRALKRYGSRDCFDLGNAETIIPVAPAASLSLRFDARYVAAFQATQIANLRPQAESIALAREPEEYSKKFLYNQRRELRLFQEQGGVIRDLLEFPPEDLAGIYADLFERRWGFPVPAKKNLPAMLTIMRPFMFGSLLQQGDRSVAIQILYRVESPGWISVEYINGGVDPEYKDISPGSILTYLNTQAAWTHARAVGKPLRYSFGRADRDYKLRWCHQVPVMRT